MNLSETLIQYPELVQSDFPGKSKEEVIKNIVALLNKNGVLNSQDQFEKDVFTREADCSTGIGMGIAIPHAKSDGVAIPCFTVIRLAQEVEWDSFDDLPVKLVMMLAVPDGNPSEFLKLLSTLSYNLMNDEFREGLITAGSPEEILEQFKALKPAEL